MLENALGAKWSGREMIDMALGANWYAALPAKPDYHPHCKCPPQSWTRLVQQPDRRCRGVLQLGTIP